jgi:hypothetical protein
MLSAWHLKKGQNLFLSSAAGKWESEVKVGTWEKYFHAAEVALLVLL